MSKQQQSARDAAIDTRKLINALTERLEAVKEGLAEEDASPTRNQAVVAYCDGQIYQIEYLLSDINFGCYDAAKGESVTVKGEPPDLKSILLEIVCNYPEAIEQIKAMENVTAAHYGLAYGVTPALFVSHGYDGVQDRVRLQEKPDPAESTATCSHQWRDTEFEKQLVKNFDIAPSEMKPERTYRCIRCKETIEPAQQPEPSEVCETDFEDAEAIAKFFHYTYERLAPDFGYETRPDTKQFDAESPNGKLMIAVCGEFLAGIRKPATPPASEPSRDAMVELINNEWVKYINDTGGRKVEEWFADFCLDQLAHFAGQRAEVAALKIALADAIRCPMGVCPDSAVGLLTVEELKDAENRRIEGKSPTIKHIGLTGDQNEQ